MKVEKIGAQLVVTDSVEYPGKVVDFTALHARENVTTTHTTITDLANPALFWSCPNADFEGDLGGITDQAAIQAYLRSIVGS